MIGAGGITWAVEAVFASTLLMLLVLVLRGPVRGAFGPAISYSLWLLPVARLFLPPLPATWQASAAAPLAQASEGITVYMVAPMELAPAVAAVPGVSLATITLILWAAGALGFLLWHVIGYRRFCRSMLRDARELRHGIVRVIETDAAAGPLAFGIWRKYVAFPSDFKDRYDADERALALAHELTHHARGDLFANWLALFVLSLHWFNPIAWIAFRAFRADQEMACDARVLANRSPAYAHAYGRAIVKSAHGGAVSAACHLHTINDLKGRLKMLSNKKKSRSRVFGGGVGVGALLLLGLGMTASGTQAAERLSGGVGKTLGVDLATPVALPPAIIAPAIIAPAAALAQTAPAAPPAAAQPQAPDLPAPPAPAAEPGTMISSKSGSTVVMVAAPGEKVRKEIRIVTSDKNGTHVLEPLSMERLRSAAGELRDPVRVVMIEKDGKSTLSHGTINLIGGKDSECETLKASSGVPGTSGKPGDKPRVIICKHVSRSVADAAGMPGTVREAQRSGFQGALDGLREARASLAGNKDMSAEARDGAVKGIDRAIARLEEKLAKVN